MSQIDFVFAGHPYPGMRLLDVERLSTMQVNTLVELQQTNQPAGLSALSLREMAFMIQWGRIAVESSSDEWLDSIDSHPLLTIFPLSTKIAAESVSLGQDFPNDPAAQIIVATARCHRLTLITADERIRKSGKVRVV